MKNAIVFLSLSFLANSFCKGDLRFQDCKNLLDSSDSNLAIYYNDYRPNSIIVTLDSEISGINKDHSKSIFKEFPEDSIRELTHIYNVNAVNFLDVKSYKQIFLIETDSNNIFDLQKIVEKLNKTDGIYCAEISYNSDDSSEVPNDEFYEDGTLWNLKSEGVSADKAWNINTGSNNVKVGVIDSGIMNHVDLNTNVVSGYDFYNNNYITNDDEDDHGTHVAGIIGATGNNSEGVVGINWNVDLVPLQTNNSEGMHSEADRIEAVNYAINSRGAANQISILNHSIGGYGIRTGLREAIKNYPGLFVWSAGNDDTNVDEYISSYGSSDLDNLISVGSIDRYNNRSDFSNYSYSGENDYESLIVGTLDVPIIE